ncbi:MAG TPA: hypothetical protein VHN14_30600 [Kofleriaceae bacterium]|jgi:hypothetical protein|nr:hypothetical protein [Kofleriaceae bacterium]
MLGELEMPTTIGMKSEGFYDRNSSFQRVTMEAVIGWAREAIAEMTLPDEPAPITLADYGCSEGKNSIAAMGHLVNALRARHPQQPLCVVHTDLPTNNFNRLFLSLHDPTQNNYFQSEGKRHDGIFSLTASGSFFDPLLAPKSVTLATTFISLQWMDRVPDVPIPEFIGYMEASPAAQQAFARQAQEDLTRFYSARATELASGGKLLIIIPGSDGQRRSSDGGYNLLNDAIGDLVRAGRISQGRFESFVMPNYFRTLEELTAPVTLPSSPLHEVFSIDRSETLELPIPFEEEYRRTGDVLAYASTYTGFLRALSEPVVVSGLFEPGQDRAVVDELYDRVRARLVATPQRYTVRNIEVAALLTRR